MTASTETDNDRTLQFYQARGFEIFGESTENVEGTAVPVIDL